MIVLVDRAADSAETVVAAGKYIGKREFVQTGGPGCLDDAHIGQIVAGDGIKLDLQILRISADVVRLQDPVRDGAFFCVFPADTDSALSLRFRNQILAVQQINSGIVKLYH